MTITTNRISRTRKILLPILRRFLSGGFVTSWSGCLSLASVGRCPLVRIYGSIIRNISLRTDYGEGTRSGQEEKAEGA
jgi:hypothetical protein